MYCILTKLSDHVVVIESLYVNGYDAVFAVLGKMIFSLRFATRRDRDNLTAFLDDFSLVYQ